MQDLASQAYGIYDDEAIFDTICVASVGISFKVHPNAFDHARMAMFRQLLFRQTDCRNFGITKDSIGEEGFFFGKWEIRECDPLRNPGR